MTSEPSLTRTDLVIETMISLAGRPGRSILTALGTVLGVASLVITLGLASTAGNQIIGRFDELQATEVRIRPVIPSDPSTQIVRNNIPFAAEDAVLRLNGVRAVGSSSVVNTEGSLISTVQVNDPLGQSGHRLIVMAVSPGMFSVAEPTMSSGVTINGWHNSEAARVAVLGRNAAQRLGVVDTSVNPSLFIGDDAFTVIGIISAVVREPSLLDAVILPNRTAGEVFGTPGAEEVVITTQIGAAEVVGGQAALALVPTDPTSLQVFVPPSPTRARDGAQADLNMLFLLLGGVSLTVGGIGIANVTLVSVLERTPEIGLRRALGATRRHIAVQFLTESAALGTIAGLVGTSLGIAVMVGVAAVRNWTPALDLTLPLVSPLLGTIVGLLAGLYPAFKAAATAPIAALRGTST